MEQATASNLISTPKSGEGFWLWLVKLATGPFIFILIAVHFIVNHTASTGLLQYTQVLTYYQIWVVPIMEALFLALVVTHSLLGLRSIILDMHPTETVLKFINWLFLFVGIVAFVYGLWLITRIVSSGIGM